MPAVQVSDTKLNRLPVASNINMFHSSSCPTKGPVDNTTSSGMAPGKLAQGHPYASTKGADQPCALCA